MPRTTRTMVLVGLAALLGSLVGFSVGFSLQREERGAKSPDVRERPEALERKWAAELAEIARDSKPAILGPVAFPADSRSAEEARGALSGRSSPAGSPAGAPIYRDRTLAQWVACLSDPTTRDAAAGQLFAGDPESAELLVALLTAGGSESIHSLAFSTLEEMGAPALLPLRDRLAAGDDRQRMAAARLLGRVRPIEPETVLALGKALRDASNDVRMNVGAALRALGPEAAAAVPALVEALERTTGYVRNRFIEAVGAIGPAAAAAEPVLRGLLGITEEPFQRLAVATALFRIGAPSKDLLPVVVEAARSGAPGLRRFAVTCLGQFGAEAAGVTALLAEALQDPEVVVRACAAEALGRIGPPAVDAIPALEAACSDGDRRVQSLAASALRKIRGE